MLKLIIEDDEGHTTVVPLVRDEVTIGRKEGNTIRLTERNVSRRHARLLRQDAGFALEDLGSYTGVRVNGTRISSAVVLRDGDRIQIGDYRIDLRSDEARLVKDTSPTSPTLPVSPPAAAPPPASPAAAPAPNRAAAAAAVTVPAAPAVGAEPFAASPASPSAGGVQGPPPLPGQASAGPAGVVPPAPQPNPASGPQPLAPGRSPVPRPTAANLAGGQAGAPTALEGTPTIPLRTLESPPEPVVVTEQASRLVVLNTDLAGHEFSLGRASQVIGRTDENDIVLNHRSISRHHAKILREGTRTSIVDLQSANGVRVNGQDYERVELHPGDVIELGHVKLRHVGAGEDFVFTPSKLGGRVKPLWLAGGVGGALVLGAVLLFALRGKKTPAEGGTIVAAGEPSKALAEPAAVPPAGEPEPTKQEPGEAPVMGQEAAEPAAAPPTPPSPGPAVAKAAPHAEPLAPADEAPSPQTTLAAVNQAIATERWEDASATLDELLKHKKAEPGASWIPEAEALKARIAEERKNAALLAEVDEAVAARDGERALGRIQAIPATSAFKVKALGRQADAVRLAAKQHMARAEAAQQKGACDEVKAEARVIHRLDPENEEITAIVRACRPGAATHGPVAARTPSRPPSTPVSTVKARNDVAQVRDAEEPKQDPAELIKQARDAWMKQQYGNAIDLSKKALKLRPGSTDAYQIIAVCACAQRDADGAQKAYAKVDERSRTLVRSTCTRNGVHLSD